MANNSSNNPIIKLIFTLDYEIHGNGYGSPYKLMIEPTYRLMELMEKFGARLVIFADVAEILRFRDYYEETGQDRFHYTEIVKQLQSAIKRGHNVQLHIHSSYFKAKFNGQKWEQNWAEYNMAALPFDRIFEMIRISKSWLQAQLIPINPGYQCFAFRAANWSMVPTSNIYRALVENGIRVDTSVYKWGRQFGHVDYNYIDAHSNIFSYKASSHDINILDENGIIKEYPIYTENRPFWHFISLMRLYRIFRAQLLNHRQDEPFDLDTKIDFKKLSIYSFFRRNPWKLDFNQANGTQMIKALKRIMRKHIGHPEVIDLISIGHSKTFIRYNQKTLRKFLRYASKQVSVKFGTIQC